MGTITISFDELKNLVVMANESFIQSGKHTITKTDAYAQYGKRTIDLLIANKLIKDYGLSHGKCRFLVSEIITGIEYIRVNYKSDKNK